MHSFTAFVQTVLISPVSSILIQIGGFKGNSLFFPLSLVISHSLSSSSSSLSLSESLSLSLPPTLSPSINCVVCL